MVLEEVAHIFVLKMLEDFLDPLLVCESTVVPKK
jgi:hypothetical protein